MAQRNIYWVMMQKCFGQIAGSTKMAICIKKALSISQPSRRVQEYVSERFSYREMKIISAVRLDSFIFKLSDEEKASTAGRWSPYTLMGAFMCILLQYWGI
ncbi:hypothetical protein ACFX19_001905 [Malus domestica]